MKNDHVIEGELACPPYTKPAGKSTKHMFRVMTEEEDFRGEKRYEEHVIETFSEDFLAPLSGAGVGSLIQVPFSLRSNPWTNKKGEIVYFTKPDLAGPVKVLELIKDPAPNDEPADDAEADDIPF